MIYIMKLYYICNLADVIQANALCKILWDNMKSCGVRLINWVLYDAKNDDEYDIYSYTLHLIFIINIWNI